MSPWPGRRTGIAAYAAFAAGIEQATWAAWRTLLGIAPDSQPAATGWSSLREPTRAASQPSCAASGLAQLLMQAGMFVPATEFSANLASGVFTHFKREEDETMTRGKLDEELSRMSRIVDQIRPGGIHLCNESVASTNEREGSEIGQQVIAALNEAAVKVLLVTHLFDLSQRFRREAPDGALFLRAERVSDGTRAFKIREGEALPTSHGKDLYEEIFRDDLSASSASD